MLNWNWSGFFGYLVNPFILQGVFTTLWLTVVAILAGLVLGFGLALMRRSSSRILSGLAGAYIWLFRGTPLLVQLIVIYTALPELGIRFNVWQAALIGLSLNEAAYLAEIIRAGIEAVPKGQVRAARALGMREPQIMRSIVLPQALKIIVPPLGNSVNGLLKTTSVTSVISMEELLRRTQVLIQERFEVLELFTVAAIYYLLLTTLWDLVQRRIERRFGRSDQPLAASEQR
ncbi:amino acid ABC transporter permease [Aureimonas phyllosphaerae]|uniref:Glutamate/aspartate import permease protein GltK n=1 Tax=Aureimonas phyllosphaerae TaxID=1166078 RepID=A0A7W6FV80_9HYPH|nr:amino acid ABC transporter permease [Aureimonas phyllosphaerae]MBB3937004.1 polar amino acid transport system permease protein [Aureimonas phyllosphaerae]MBB3960881.1 polar amino acid transport system permease protein [Aureimonas phyllosphaerae]SFF51622.1 amino acid ABC transporter membrane protein, PAAT family [Aureimonas phyllosphaerae]